MREGGSDAVVVPAVGSGSSLACARSLGREGVYTIAASADASPPAAASRHCDELRAVTSPSEDLEAYARDLLALAGRADVRTVVPVREPDIYVLSKYRDEFAAHAGTPWESFAGVRRVQDRRHLLETAASAGVGTPRWALADDWDRWDETTVVKPRYSLLVRDGAPFYGGVRFLEDGDPPDVDDLVAAMAHVPLAQEYVPGSEERGFFALYDRGDPVATFQHRRVRSYKYAGGASVFRESVHDDALERAGRGLLDALDWHGLAMVEFKRDPRDGEYKLMEVNPRFWGSLSLAVAAGVDFPRHYYRLATAGTDETDGVDTPVAADAGYETGVGCHVVHGEVSYLHSLLTEQYDHTSRPPMLPELAAVAGSFVTDRHFDFLAVDDPGPFLSVFSATGRAATGRLTARLSAALASALGL